MRIAIALCTALTVMTTFAHAAERRERPERAESKYYESDGLKLHYTDQGQGEPVLLIHGSGTSGNTNWRITRVVQILKDDYRVITPDVRGHGRSDTPEDNQYGVDDVHDMIALLDHLGIDKAHVVGYSMGGMISIKLTTMFPDRVISATIGGMGWIEADSEDAASFADTKNETKFRASIQGFGEFGTTAKEMIEFPRPVQAIIGTDDPGQIMRLNKWLEIVPDLEVHYIEGANHSDCIQREEFRTRIRAFIDKHRTESPSADD